MGEAHDAQVLGSFSESGCEWAEPAPRSRCGVNLASSVSNQLRRDAGFFVYDVIATSTQANGLTSHHETMLVCEQTEEDESRGNGTDKVS